MPELETKLVGWTPLPAGVIPVEVASFHHAFFVGVNVFHGRVDHDRSLVIFPTECRVRVGDMEDGIDRKTIEEAGWAIISGLGLDDRNAGLQIITLKVGEKFYVPPAGLWPYDFPARFKRDEADIDDCWRDIFEINRGFLAWSDFTSCGRLGWHLCPDDYFYIRFSIEEMGGTQKWTLHRSEASIRELLQKWYGSKAQLDIDGSIACLRIPSGLDARSFVGRNGRMAKMISEILGVKYTRVLVI